MISNATFFSTLLALLMVWMPMTASAHPHMWITYELTVDYDKGMVTGVDHVWSFDDAYAGMALEGLDTNNDGKYDQKELAPLLKVNMDGLKEFNYFTVAKLGDEELAFSPPTNARLEYNSKKVLSLHFHLSLVKPVFADAQGLTFAVFDPSYFIDFEPEKTNAVKLAAAPPGCRASLIDPDAQKIDAQSKKLGDAIAQQFGGAAIGFGSYKTVAITCKKS
ncbi:DUF1007 family protein [Hyphomicrobium sp.]|uniref:DUF1007 family protein n=1 Tax=Hyphomicrobium sp. TaxID=82 RepID=UPI002BE1F6B9|nr:DUF1007 family protein [Hyphomicrobium sp.]HVZ03223.1 DUF1007 family protein [Hyphomicrobium sp.]